MSNSKGYFYILLRHLHNIKKGFICKHLLIKCLLTKSILGGKLNMEFTILRGGSRTFIIRDIDRPAFGIHIGNGDDMIQVFQWANREFKKLKALNAFCGGACNE